MSKAELIELINLDDYDLKEWLYNVGVDEAREIFIQAMKDVEQDTKNGCAEAVSHDDLWLECREPCQISDEAKPA